MDLLDKNTWILGQLDRSIIIGQPIYLGFKTGAVFYIPCVDMMWLLRIAFCKEHLEYSSTEYSQQHSDEKTEKLPPRHATDRDTTSTHQSNAPKDAQWTFYLQKKWHCIRKTFMRNATVVSCFTLKKRISSGKLVLFNSRNPQKQIFWKIKLSYLKVQQSQVTSWVFVRHQCRRSIPPFDTSRRRIIVLFDALRWYFGCC